MQCLKYQILTSIVMVLLMWTLTSAQSVPPQRETLGEKCSLSIAQAPQLRGLRLGMEQATVLARFANATAEPPDEFGLSRMQISFVQSKYLMSRITHSLGVSDGIEIDTGAGTAAGRAYSADNSKFPDFEGVSKLRFRFVDKKLAYLEVTYDGTVRWSSPDEFAQSLAKSLGLSGVWQKGFDSETFTETRILECNGFNVTASPNVVLLEDVLALQTIEKRRQEAVERKKREAEAKKKAFKP